METLTEANTLKKGSIDESAVDGEQELDPGEEWPLDDSYEDELEDQVSDEPLDAPITQTDELAEIDAPHSVPDPDQTATGSNTYAELHAHRSNDLVHDQEPSTAGDHFDEEVDHEASSTESLTAKRPFSEAIVEEPQDSEGQGGSTPTI